MGTAEDHEAELRQLRAEVGRLLDRTAVEDVLFDYAAAMDGQDFARFRDLFTADIVVEHGGGRMVGREAVLAGLDEAIGRHFTSHHMITNHRVTMAPPDHARAVGYFHSIHLDDPAQPAQHDDHGGWYLVELVRADGAWRISRLKQVSVWSDGNRRPTGPLDPVILVELRDHLSGAAPAPTSVGGAP
jgi:ketosteroid isomerase-like protein